MTKLKIAKLSQLPVGSMKQVKVEGKDDVAVANVNGKIYAMRGICNHEGGPLGEGEFDGKIVTCPWHGSKWDITTGKLVEFPIELDPEPTYKVTVEGDDIYIEI